MTNDRFNELYYQFFPVANNYKGVKVAWVTANNDLRYGIALELYWDSEDIVRLRVEEENIDGETFTSAPTVDRVAVIS